MIGQLLIAGCDLSDAVFDATEIDNQILAEIERALLDVELHLRCEAGRSFPTWLSNGFMARPAAKDYQAQRLLELERRVAKLEGVADPDQIMDKMGDCCGMAIGRIVRGLNDGSMPSRPPSSSSCAFMNLATTSPETWW